MKILALNGSPRKGSNTDILVDETLKGLADKNHSHEKVYLYKHEILPCIDCRKCVAPERFGKRMLTCAVKNP